METINGLLRELNNRVPVSISKRLEGLKNLNSKLEIAKAENEENKTEESQEQLDEIIDFIEDTTEDLIEDLKELVVKKREEEQRSIQLAKKEAEQKRLELAKRKAEIEAVKLAQKRELEEKEKQDLQKEKLINEAIDTSLPKDKDSEKKSGIGWGSLALGTVLLVLSAGAVNYFAKKR